MTSSATHQRILEFTEALDELATPAGGYICLSADTLARLLSPFAEPEMVSALLAEIERQPDACLSSRGSLETISWEDLANEVVIFDPRFDVTVTELGVSEVSDADDLVAAVNRRFPSMEQELISFVPVVPRVEELMARLRQSCRVGSIDPSVSRVFDLVSKNLGWWASVGLVLVFAAALRSSASFSDATRRDPEIAWAIFVYILTAAIGGWTLTMIESLILARD